MGRDEKIRTTVIYFRKLVCRLCHGPGLHATTSTQTAQPRHDDAKDQVKTSPRSQPRRHRSPHFVTQTTQIDNYSTNLFITPQPRHDGATDQASTPRRRHAANHVDIGRRMSSHQLPEIDTTNLFITPQPRHDVDNDGATTPRRCHEPGQHATTSTYVVTPTSGNI